MHRSHFTILAAAFLMLCGCDKKPASTSAQSQNRQFDVKGIVRGIGFAEKEITIEHEEIPDYMPSMAMPFAVKDMKEVEPLSVGDGVQFQYVVTPNDSWVANVRKIDAKLVKLPQAADDSADSEKTQRGKEGDALPAFNLVNDKGQPITGASFEGKPLVLTFIFTRCPVPNFCPLMSKNFAQLEEKTAADPKLKGTQLLSVSIDPEYDTPEVLAKYATQFRRQGTDRWQFATGPVDEVSKLASFFSLQAKPAGGTIEHGLATAVVDENGNIRKILRGNAWRVEEVVEELGKL